MKLQNKIHTYTSLLFGILLVAINFSVYFLFSQLSIDSRKNQVEAAAENMIHGIQRAPVSIAAEDLLRAYVPLDGMLRLMRPEGDFLAPITSSSEQSLSLMKGVFNETRQVRIITHESNRYILVSVPMIWSNGEVVNLQVTESLQPTMQTLQVLKIVLIAVTGIALIPVVISGRLLGRLITHPITSMISTMKEIQRSGKFKRLPLNSSSRDELVEMGETFNDMIELLERNFVRQEQFVSNASHELKTPLTIIESYASLLKRRGLQNPNIFAESVEAIHSEAIRMKDMAEQLLLLARNEEQWNVVLEPVRLTKVGTELKATFENAFARQIQLDVQTDCTAFTDENKLKQLLFIFLDNARKYSDEPIHLMIDIVSGTAQPCIRITDQGIGIPEEKLSKVFDRFYRVDEARSREEGGAGLGLSLATGIAQAIQAQIGLESIEGSGTTATIILPAVPK
ncbi:MULTISPECIES: sensor histidine kinase [Paenibacillus]|uniref:histidine kinase n=1 Tax=Paenibacillus polymyxa (strain SC2) TaxID=886882 RepID=E3EFN4_PAEPS|nr:MULTISPECIES: HAMP domain-containing sensor histidine kinase [Paenibacillus]ADO55525.1 histidine kinase [Paenibacillus polymyxa SC2]MBU9709073.1 HAMP domain-containing histidine kinase [Paenibacillus sp. AK121]MEE4566631.1 HAMP domain-containing sensor histidine kinase [Paenibacillus polymyxa]WPQ58300.1 HAMP domain-containing sensor histidine kinase [Paenibacillus polymyxa]CCC84345.1 signal transduction histidine kinase [Paenibacillus polymyxa M1]